MNDDDAPAPPSIRGASYQRFIGRGGFSHVYLFRQRQLGRGVAVKVLDREVDDRARRRFEAETSLMARMSPHPSVVSVIDAGRAEDGREYIVMEYCPPPDLGRIARSEPLSVEQALKYAIQVAGAVETIHRAGYLHRDIKPSNILLTEYRRPVLTDFGIATPIEAQDVEDESGGASPPWAPPEQLRGEEALTLAADVYGLAATVYTMLTGHAPHTDRAPDGRNDLLSMLQRAQAGRIPPITRPDAPEQLRRVLRTAMAPRPENRFATVLAFARELQQVQRSLGQAPTELDVMAEQPDVGARGADAAPDATVLRPVTAIDPYSPAADSAAADATRFKPRVITPLPEGRDRTEERTVLRGELDRVDTAPEPRFDPAPLAPSSPPAPGSGGSGSAAPGFGGPRTGRDLPAPDAGGARRPTRRGVAVALAALVVLVLIGSVAWWSLLRDEGHSTVVDRASSPAPDVVGPRNGLVSDSGVQDLTLTAADGQVRATWTYDGEAAGFLYAVVDPGAQKVVQETKEPAVTVPALPGRTCLEVVVRFADGSSSDPVTACTDTP